MADGLSILELARVHHEVFLEVLRETPPEELPEVATAASEFLLEVLATFDMAQRGFLDGADGRSRTCEGPRSGSGSRLPDRRLRTQPAGSAPGSAGSTDPDDLPAVHL